MRAASDIPASPVLAVMGLGVLIALAGHIVRSKGTVALGLVLVFLATAGMIVGGFAAFHQDSNDPRTKCGDDILCSAPLPKDGPNGQMGGFVGGHATKMFAYNDRDGSPLLIAGRRTGQYGQRHDGVPRVGDRPQQGGRREHPAARGHHRVGR